MEETKDDREASLEKQTTVTAELKCGSLKICTVEQIAKMVESHLGETHNKEIYFNFFLVHIGARPACGIVLRELNRGKPIPSSKMKPFLQELEEKLGLKAILRPPWENSIFYNPLSVSSDGVEYFIREEEKSSLEKRFVEKSVCQALGEFFGYIQAFDRLPCSRHDQVHAKNFRHDTGPTPDHVLPEMDPNKIHQHCNVVWVMDGLECFHEIMNATTTRLILLKHKADKIIQILQLAKEKIKEQGQTTHFMNTLQVNMLRTADTRIMGVQI